MKVRVKSGRDLDMCVRTMRFIAGTKSCDKED